MDSMKVLKENIKTAKSFNPMSEEEVTEILERTIPLALNGKYEDYKTYTPDPDHEHNEDEVG